MAPRVVELSLPPDAIHIPGTSRVIADRLSRVYAPSGNGVVNETIHPALAHATRTTMPDRNDSWYRAYKRVTSYTLDVGYLPVGLWFAPPAYMQTADVQKQWLWRYPEQVNSELEAAWAELASCGLRDAAALARRSTYPAYSRA